MRHIPLALALFITGCAELGEPPIDTTGFAGAAGVCADVPATGAHDGRPMFIYYGAYQRADGSGIHWPATLELLASTPGTESVLVVNPVDPCAKFRPWIEAGGLLAYKLARSPAQRPDPNLEALLDAGSAARFVADRLAEGYSYVAVDEISHAHSPGAWKNGGRYARKFIALLDELEVMGLRRRIILYVNSYNNAGRLAQFGDVLRACHDHCRVIASEVYQHIANVMRSARGEYRPEARPTSCTFNLDCFNKLASELDRVSPGINERVISVLRLDDKGYNAGRVDSLCKASSQLSSRGGLDHMYGRLHAGSVARQQRGAGGYTPARVGRHPNWGAIHQARCLGGLNSWWPGSDGDPLDSPDEDPDPEGPAPEAPTIDRAVDGDFLGNGRADLAVFRPSNGTWYIAGASAPIPYGQAGDVPAPADYDGDGIIDIAVRRPGTRTFYRRGAGAIQYGAIEDQVVAADYNGDGAAELVLFRPSNATWYFHAGGFKAFGAAGDIPVPGDYDGDGDAELAVYRPSNGTWYIDGQGSIQHGAAGDVPVAADYDGNGSLDIAVWRPLGRTWYIRGQASVSYGAQEDIPVPADWNGDGRAQIAMWRPSNRQWYIYGSSGIQFGASLDVPVSARLNRRIRGM